MSAWTLGAVLIATSFCFIFHSSSSLLLDDRRLFINKGIAFFHHHLAHTYINYDAMTVKDSSDEHVQALRRVYENANPTDPPSPNDIFHVTYHLDPTTGKGIILWDDILAAFKNVVHVKTGTKLLSFLKGQDFKK
jgi:hypothetical protein